MNGLESTPQPPRDSTGVAERTGGSVRRLTPEQRAAWQAAPPGDRDQTLQAIRLRHVRDTLGGAVAEGRVAQADADAVLEGLMRGEDAHQLRRELRRAGVLPGHVRRSDR